MTRTWILILGALAAVGFATIVLVIIPQVMLVEVPAAAELVDYDDLQQRGREVYISEGCLYCHSQQVRDPAFTTDVTRGWGPRATVPADYAFDDPHLLGTMRTGPDLINVGQRMPDPQWHLIHLYQPRALIEWSIMPAFPYLFEERDSTAAIGPREVVVNVPPGHRPPGTVIVATPDAVALVEYLLSLQRQYPVPAAPAVGGRSAMTMP